MKKGRISRLSKLGGLAAGLAVDAARAGADALRHTRDDAAAALHARVADRLARQLGEMKGLPLKVGQLLSYLDDAIPEEHRHIYRRVLGRLQARAGHLPWDQMQPVLTEGLGGDPHEVFAHFEQEPFAAASIGQVHRARTHEGVEVAVKAQYPGIAEAITADLANAEALVGTMQRLLPSTDLRIFLDEVRARIGEECDYTREAAWQDAFREAWAHDPQIVIPEVHRERSGARVLTTTFIDALSWSEAIEAAPDLKRQWGRNIFRFVFGSLYVHGMFNADPHPGNYLFYPDGRVAFLDFGCVQVYPPDALAAFMAVRDGAIAGETGPAFEAKIDALLQRDTPLEAETRAMLDGYLRLSFEPVVAPQPYRYTRDYTERLTRRAADAKLLLARKALRHGIPSVGRQGLVFITRINFGLASILATLGAEDDWRAVMDDLLAHAPDRQPDA